MSADNEQLGDPERAELLRRLDACLAEKDRRKAEAKGLRGILRRIAELVQRGRVRKDDFADSSGFNDVPRMDLGEPK